MWEERLELPINSFKQAICEGRQQIGLWCTLSDAYVIEVVAGAGFDWLLIDMEHSPNDLRKFCLSFRQSLPIQFLQW
jgi:4-hydroxy-2-oxoheptanedioate aldolase